jgi:hypothetical protein
VASCYVAGSITVLAETEIEIAGLNALCKPVAETETEIAGLKL